MKSTFARLLALALALSLTACGGGKATFTIGGHVTGLVQNGLVLSTNGGDVAVNPPAASIDKSPATAPSVPYSFAKQLEYGEQYLVSVKTNPAHQNCTVNPYYAQDTAGRLASIDIPVDCVLNQFLIGGTISGLTADGLVLTNGTTGGTFPAAKDTASFTFAAPVVYGTTYGVTVLTQPTGLFCSVSNGAGTMADSAVTNIAVTCVPAT
jgi:hypothetical protein